MFLTAYSTKMAARAHIAKNQIFLAACKFIKEVVLETRSADAMVGGCWTRS